MYTDSSKTYEFFEDQGHNKFMYTAIQSDQSFSIHIVNGTLAYEK